MSDSKQEWEGVVTKWGRSLQARAFNKSESNGLEEALKSKKDTSPTSQASERCKITHLNEGLLETWFSESLDSPQ